MDILPLPAELLAEPALPGREETARYAVGAGDTGSLGPQQPALVQRRRKEIGLHADASSGWGALIQTAVSVWRPLAACCSPAAAGISASAMNEGPGRQVRWQELTKGECFGLLARQQVGRVAVVDDRGPVVFPVNFVLDRHMVVFRTDEGTKLDAAASGSRVAFEIDGIDAAAHTGWSVVIRGEAVEVTDPQELARLRKLPLFPWAPGARSRYVRILPAKLTGRRISRPGGPSGQGGDRGLRPRPRGRW